MKVIASLAVLALLAVAALVVMNGCRGNLRAVAVSGETTRDGWEHFTSMDTDCRLVWGGGKYWWQCAIPGMSQPNP